LAILHLFDKFKQNPEPIKDSLIKIKNGDSLLKDKLINDYKPFVIKVISKTTGRHVDIDNSEELSIGLMAFNEAIDCYNPEKNASFIKFAETVIKRRLIDYIRSNSKHNKVYPFTYFESDDTEDNSQFEERYLRDDASKHFDNIETKEEILYFTKELADFGITLNDLVETSPKHIDSKRLAIKIARLLADNRELSEKLMKTRKIPMTELLKLIDVNHKTIERNRKFIIAVYFILTSNLDVMMGYVENIERGAKVHG